jgi:methionyl aminopeptidase
MKTMAKKTTKATKKADKKTTKVVKKAEKKSKKTTTAAKKTTKAAKKTTKAKTTEKISVKEEKDDKTIESSTVKDEKKKTEAEIEAEEEEAKEKQLRIDSFKKAGEIWREVQEIIKPKVKIGTKLLDLCIEIEDNIIEKGGDIGFPANICLNDIAAHYSPDADDETVISEEDIVKVDFGVAIEGYVVDGAFTISFNTEELTKNMILAVETAVLKGMGMIKPGVKTNAIGKATYDIIKGFGYNVIKSLSGHNIEQWQVHGGKEIPNVPMPTGFPFVEGEVYAIECFASTGSGNIHRSSTCNIYSYELASDRIPLRGKVTRKVLGWINHNKMTLPFSTRELLKEFSTGKFALREFLKAGKLVEHFILRETKGVYVAQWEHTFMVTADGIERLT